MVVCYGVITTFHSGILLSDYPVTWRMVPEEQLHHCKNLKPQSLHFNSCLYPWENDLKAINVYFDS
jgi:hypothetical protein